MLSPYLFALYIDSIVDRVRNSRFGCYIKDVCMSVLLYADDILLVAYSVSAVENLLHICEHELTLLDMSINTKKSACVRIGFCFRHTCSIISTADVREIRWADCVRYLGIHIMSAKNFACSLTDAKFYYVCRCDNMVLLLHSCVLFKLLFLHCIVFLIIFPF